MDYLLKNILQNLETQYKCLCPPYYNEMHCIILFCTRVSLSAKEAFEMKISPIIIDNTNIQAWEMKPYVTLVSITI